MTPAWNGCQLARFSDKPCEGALIRVHLIPRQVIKRHLPINQVRNAINCRATWVWGCGGLTGIGGHHGQLDHTRNLRIPREAIPALTEDWAEDNNLTWFLDREYGPKA